MEHLIYLFHLCEILDENNYAIITYSNTFSITKLNYNSEPCLT